MPAVLGMTDARPSSWLAELLGVELPQEGSEFMLRGRPFRMAAGIPRDSAVPSATQAQTSEVFEFLWQKETFQGPSALSVLRTWYAERYGNVADAAWWDSYGPSPLLLDAGCGAGISSLELFGARLGQVRYLGVDISKAVDRAQARFREQELLGAFLQTDVKSLPLSPESVDVIFSQGALHHTDSTEEAFASLARLLKPGGRFLFYVYREKGPVREFTDDEVRGRLGTMSLDDAWEALIPLTRFGKYLGDLDIEIDVPLSIEFLDIPSGPISLQRFFYWHIAKAFYHPDLTLEEMNHINFDWYVPANAHRHTCEDVRAWCADAALEIEHENLQPAGITVIARRALA